MKSTSQGGVLPDISAGGTDRENQERVPGCRGETPWSGVGEVGRKNDLKSVLLRARSCHGSWEAADQNLTGHLIILSLPRRTAFVPTPLSPCKHSESSPSHRHGQGLRKLQWNRNTWADTGKWWCLWDDEVHKNTTDCFRSIKCKLSTQTCLWT